MDKDVQIVDRNGQWYLVDQDGQPVPGADEPHISREEAEAHLTAMLQEAPAEPPAEPEPEVAKAAPGQVPTAFIPLMKIDEERHEVWGYGALEQPDHSDEVMDYESSKPYWMRWSESAQKRTGGRSFGNLRSMHKAVAAGRLISFQPDDKGKGFFVGAHVVDPDEWAKVQAGVYTGFSVGGRYVKRWYDARLGKTRYTADPAELSLVDAPCIPGATFAVIKADGLTEDRAFQPTDGQNVLKAEIPDAPEPAGSMDAEGETVEKAPLNDQSIQINPSQPPSQETLAGRHAGVEEVTALADQLIQAGDIPTLGKLISVLSERLEKAGQWDEGKHPRAKDGKFGSGGGSSSGSQEAAAGSEGKPGGQGKGRVTYDRASELQRKHDTTAEGLTPAEHREMADYWDSRTDSFAADAHAQYHRGEADRKEKEASAAPAAPAEQPKAEAPAAETEVQRRQNLTDKFYPGKNHITGADGSTDGSTQIMSGRMGDKTATVNTPDGETMDTWEVRVRTGKAAPEHYYFDTREEAMQHANSHLDPENFKEPQAGGKAPAEQPAAPKKAGSGIKLGDRVDFGPNGGKLYIVGRQGSHYLTSEKKPTSRDYENPNLSGAVHTSTQGKVIGHHEDAPPTPTGFDEDNPKYGKADQAEGLKKIHVKPREQRLVKVRRPAPRMIKVRTV